jgi:amino acid permease
VLCVVRVSKCNKSSHEKSLRHLTSLTNNFYNLIIYIILFIIYMNRIKQVMRKPLSETDIKTDFKVQTQNTNLSTVSKI